MGNSTQVFSPKFMHDRLASVVESYRDLLLEDEQRLQEAMQEYEQSCWAASTQRAA